MNERIKELADKAQEYAEWMTPQGLEWFDNFKEQFAELIVQECIGKVTKVSDSIKQFDSDNIDGIDLCDLITYHIKKHFGVD